MDWKEEKGKLVKHYWFESFKEAWIFLEKLAVIAEKEDHHPEIHNVYNQVKISLCTHEAGNKITEKDLNLARLIDLIK